MLPRRQSDIDAPSAPFVSSVAALTFPLLCACRASVVASGSPVRPRMRLAARRGLLSALLFVCLCVLLLCSGVLTSDLPSELRLLAVTSVFTRQQMIGIFLQTEAVFALIVSQMLLDVTFRFI